MASTQRMVEIDRSGPGVLVSAKVLDEPLVELSEERIFQHTHPHGYPCEYPCEWSEDANI